MSEENEIPLSSLAQRVIGVPLLIEERRAKLLGAFVTGKLETSAVLKPETSRFIGSTRGATRFQMHGNTAIVPVQGTLVNRGPWLGMAWGFTSNEGLIARLREVGEDKDVHSVILDVDTPGGLAAGMSTVADEVFSLRNKKPVIAVVNDMAASGGYNITSQATRVVTSKTAQIGHIGVVMVHLDYSKQIDQEGVRVTVFAAGKHKADGNPFEPLTDEVKGDIQKEIDALYDQFVANVAQGRTNLSPDAIRATEARVFTGRDGITAGLADEVGTIFDVLEGRAAQLPRSVRGFNLKSAKRSSPMSDNEPENTSGITKADLDKAVAEATATATANAAKAATDRIAAIMGLDAAKTRPAQANHIAMKTDMSADAAKSMLEASAEEAKTETIPKPPDRKTAEVVGEGNLPSGNQVNHGWGGIVSSVNARNGFAAKA